MRALVVYASAFGSTRGIAERIGTTLARNGIDAVVASADAAAAPDQFDAIVVGSAVHGSRWLESAAGYVGRHLVSLASMPVWLFSSGPIGDRAVAAPQPDPAQVSEFRKTLRVRDHVVFAGAFDRESADFSRSSLVERTVVRRLLPDGDWRDWVAIERWALQIARDLFERPHSARRDGAPIRSPAPGRERPVPPV